MCLLPPLNVAYGNFTLLLCRHGKEMCQTLLLIKAFFHTGVDEFSSSERFVYLQSWTEVLGHFCVSGAFSTSHRPKSSPHPTNNVGRVHPEFFSEFQLCIGWGEGKLQENFEKDALFYEGTQNDRKI